MATIILQHDKTRAVSTDACVADAGQGCMSLEIRYGAEKVIMTFPRASNAWAQMVATAINVRGVHPADAAGGA